MSEYQDDRVSSGSGEDENQDADRGLDVYNSSTIFPGIVETGTDGSGDRGLGVDNAFPMCPGIIETDPGGDGKNRTDNTNYIIIISVLSGLLVITLVALFAACIYIIVTRRKKGIVTIPNSKKTTVDIINNPKNTSNKAKKNQLPRLGNVYNEDNESGNSKPTVAVISYSTRDREDQDASNAAHHYRNIEFSCKQGEMSISENSIQNLESGVDMENNLYLDIEY